MKRRNFLYSSGILAAVLGIPPDLRAHSKTLSQTSGYSNYINFDIASGAVPREDIIKAVDHWSKIIIETSPYLTWDKYYKEVDKARIETSSLIGVSEDEIAFCRNTTEGIDTILRGIEFKSGDEIVYNSYDYPFLINTLWQLKKRYGFTILDAGIDIFNDSDQEVIDKYEKRITDQTRLLILTHISNINGREIPVKEISEIAYKNNADVLIDGAQSFAHLPINLNEIKASYFTACYHKWFRGPLGTAFFYIQKNKVDSIWPLHGDNSSKSNDIRNFDRISTLNFPAFLSITEGFNDTDNKTIAYKLERRRVLQEKLIKFLSDIKKDNLIIPDIHAGTNGICTLILKNDHPHKLREKLQSKYRIIIKSMNFPEGKNMLRISFSEDISEGDLETLANALNNECSENY